MSCPLLKIHTNLRPWRFLFTSLLLACTAWCMGQTGITVQYFDGTEQAYSIGTDGKLSFGADAMLVAENGQSTPVSIPLGIIRKVTFSDDVTTSVEEPAASGKAGLFPNPASDSFSITGPASGPQQVRIHTLTGQQVLAGTYAPGQAVPIGDLGSGLYIVSVNNVPFKLVKQ